MDEETVHALVYGFLAALGIMLLDTSSLTVMLSTSWMGALLVMYGIAIAAFIILEKMTTGSEYQGIITIILLFVSVGYILANYGIDPYKITSSILLSIAIGRIIALIIGSLPYINY